jgi:hypothetical protein|tara:strand:- start:467 stop:1033 length:567 start_codon:yes stop_codon:yes gene_type:complete
MERNGPLKDKMNRPLTKGLFYETRHPNIQASYTTKPHDREIDGKLYISLKRLYLESLDPTEESFVQTAFDGDWHQWDKVRHVSALSSFFKRSKKFRPDEPWFDEWREELEVKLRSAGIRAIVDVATGADRNRLAAAKFLATGDWKGRRGRPSKAEIARERKIQAGVQEELDADGVRMDDFEDRLKVVK